MTAAALPRQIRVAIYTRKSVTDGLDQAFNSLDAQRAAIEAYVMSQAGLGWTASTKRYDDGGFSGATTDRPAFQALLRDIEAHHVDVVAVYKIDRLSRSLRDFAKLIDLFEQNDVTFVSVTQQFSTASSIGKLTLNILMSFAEFEREVISERIADKMQATRRRGMWTGGRPILGYDVVDKKLVVNQDEASQVRAVFKLYLASCSIREVVAELNKRGWTSKAYTGKRGQQVIGYPFTKGTLHGLLTNVVYRGQTRTKSGVVAGVHEAIVDEKTWTEVQEQLRGNGRNGGAQVRNKTGAILRGLVQCGRCGSPMLHTFTTRKNRRHRYYICSRTHNEGATACPNTRVAAGPFELFVANQIRAIGRDDVVLAKTAASLAKLTADRRQELAAEQRRLEQQLRRAEQGDEQHALVAQRLDAVRNEAEAIDRGVTPNELRAALAGFDPVWGELFPAEQERILRLLIERITYHPDGGNVEIDLRPNGIDALEAEART